MKLDEATALSVERVIERRIARERRLHERQLAELRDAHQRQVQTLLVEIAGLRSERGVLQRLADRWCRPGRPA